MQNILRSKEKLDYSESFAAKCWLKEMDMSNLCKTEHAHFTIPTSWLPFTVRSVSPDSTFPSHRTEWNLSMSIKVQETHNLPNNEDEHPM